MAIQDNLELILIYKGRLEILRQQQASFGTICPPHIILEINQLVKSIENLETINSTLIDKVYYDIEKILDTTVILSIKIL